MLSDSQVRFVAAQPVAENSTRTPLIYKEALRKKKVRRKIRTTYGCLWGSIDIKANSVPRF
jgi:hypothetical protein